MEENLENNNEINYEQYVIHREMDTYWRGRDKVQLILMGLSKQIPITTLCKLNGVSPSLYYEWREIFLKRGEEGLTGVNGRSQREVELEKKIHVLERCIGELTLEKELLKKLQD